MMSPPAISFSNVSKAFRLPHERTSSIYGHVLSFFKPLVFETFQAIRSLTLTVPQGEFLGVIGANGSGKSTFLRLIAGIYPVHEGVVEISGRVAPFIELGAGFEPELSARDNVFLYGALLGLARHEVRDRYENIVAFADLVNFMDQKVKNFSSGMQARLAFAISIHADADILLVDEVLAVGDVDFQERCFGAFRKLKESGKTVIFVSHNLPEVAQFSDRVLWLERGHLKMLGEPVSIINAYKNAH